MVCSRSREPSRQGSASSASVPESLVLRRFVHSTRSRLQRTQTVMRSRVAAALRSMCVSGKMCAAPELHEL